MAITTLDQLLAALATAQRMPFFKQSAGSEGAGTWHDLFRLGALPQAGSATGSLVGAICNASTVGRFPFVNPGAGLKSYVAAIADSSSAACELYLYDRLWHNSLMSGTQTVLTTLGATATVDRPDATGAGAELWVTFYGAPGATAATLSVTYVNQAGTGGRIATYAHPANAESVGQMAPMVLQAGDTGVQRVTDYQFSISTGAVGDIGLVILRRLAELPLVTASVGNVADFAQLAMPVVDDNACLALMVLCTSTASGSHLGSIAVVQG